MLRHVSGKIRSLAYGNKFFLMSKSKKLIRENFAVEKNYGVTDVEYELVDEP